MENKSRKARTRPMKSRNERQNLINQNPGRRDHQIKHEAVNAKQFSVPMNVIIGSHIVLIE
ncbi:hypothetical protein JHK82_040581 [Glycine max]|nr:hypothetical protein JHK82_040581 [Glycine max]